MSERADVVTHAVAVVVVLAAAVYGLATATRPSPPATGTPAPEPSPSAALATTGAPGVPASAPPATSAQPSASGATPSSPPTPTPSRGPIATTSYAFNGHTYTGVSLATGWTVQAPFDGSAEVHVYQLIDGTIREFANATGVPSYPYVIVTAADGRKITYRPGAVGSDTRVLLPGSQVRVKAGDDLFAVVGPGPSSWHDFYDPSIAFQVVVSVVNFDGSDGDAAPLIVAR